MYKTAITKMYYAFIILWMWNIHTSKCLRSFGYLWIKYKQNLPELPCDCERCFSLLPLLIFQSYCNELIELYQNYKNYIIFKIFTYSFVYVCVCFSVCVPESITCTQEPKDVRRGHWIPGTGVSDSHELLCLC